MCEVPWSLDVRTTCRRSLFFFFSFFFFFFFSSLPLALLLFVCYLREHLYDHGAQSLEDVGLPLQRKQIWTRMRQRLHLQTKETNKERETNNERQQRTTKTEEQDPSKIEWMDREIRKKNSLYHTLRDVVSLSLSFFLSLSSSLFLPLLKSLRVAAVVSCGSIDISDESQEIPDTWKECQMYKQTQHTKEERKKTTEFIWICYTEISTESP